MKKFTHFAVILGLALGLVFAPMAQAEVTALSADRLTYDAAASGWKYEPSQNVRATRQVVVLVDYTKGDESQLDLAFAYQLTGDTKIYQLTERAYDNSAGDVVVSLTASGKRLIPIPLPNPVKFLYLIPTLDAGGGTEGAAVLDVRPW